MSARSIPSDPFDHAQQLLEELDEREGALDEASLERLIARHPALEHEFRELWSQCREVQRCFSDEAERVRLARQECEALLAAAASDGFTSRYSVESRIGEGGMGVVYRIVDKKLARPLAMKVILGQAAAPRTGETPFVSPRQLARFLNEAKITGQLDHPGIVPVHEVGVDEDGRAYFTMKLVQGRTLADVFARRRDGDSQWSTARVLSVIQRVCEALSFAHERGVIHRDLKPSNVMVGDFGEVYVMDWGLARRLDEESPTPDGSPNGDPDFALDEELIARATVTRDGHVVGTPSYMSPEQAAGRLGEVDARSDVYAIGAMLYELIAGHPPYVEPGQDSSGAAILGRLRAGPPRSAAPRNIAPELVAICESAMARARDSRYRDVKALAADLGAFLERRVVRAYRTGAWAEAKKWVQRNAALAGAIGTAAVVVVGLLSWTTVVQARAKVALQRSNDDLQHSNEELQRSNAEKERQRVLADSNAKLAQQHLARAEAERKSAESSAALAREQTSLAQRREREAIASEQRVQRVQEFVMATLMSSDPNVGAGRNYRVSDAMDVALNKLNRGALGDEPDVEAALNATIAVILNGSDRNDDAIELVERALPKARALWPGGHIVLASLLETSSDCLRTPGDYGQALSRIRQATEMYSQLAPAGDANVARSLGKTAECLDLSGRSDDALAVHEAALELRRRVDPTNGYAIASSLNNIGFCLVRLGRYDDALTHFQSALDIRKRVTPGDYPDIARVLDNIGDCLAQVGRSEESLAYSVQALEMRERLFHDDSRDIALSLSSVGMSLADRGNLDDALAYILAAVEMIHRIAPSGDPDVADLTSNLGRCWLALGRYSEAFEAFSEALEIRKRLLGDEHPDVANSLNAMGVCLHQMHHDVEAVRYLEAALEIRRFVFDENHPLLASTTMNLGTCLMQLRKYDEALSHLTTSLRIYQHTLPGDDLNVCGALEGVARCLHFLGRDDEALPYGESGDSMAERILPAGDPLRQACARTIGLIQTSLAGKSESR